MSDAEFHDMDVRLARIEEKQNALLDGFRAFVGDCKTINTRTDERIDALERDAVRTKTIFGFAGTALTFVAGLIGAVVRGLFR